MSKFKRNGYEHPCRRFSREWRAFRKVWLSKNPVCRRCGRAGNQVDHVKPLHSFAPWDKITRKQLLDATNVQTLCKRCHDLKTSQENAYKPKPKFCACGYPWSNGRPICGVSECQATPE